MTPKKPKSPSRTIKVGKSNARSLKDAFAGKVGPRPTKTWLDTFFRGMGLSLTTKQAPDAKVISGGLPGLGKRK